MHKNDGQCLSCYGIFEDYPGFYQPLRDWFIQLQAKCPDAHVSCAGRGRLDQSILFQRGASKAKWGQSAHNYNAALDIFQLENAQAVWKRSWFDAVVAAHLIPEITWFGRFDAPYPELPHCEWSNWNELAKASIIKLVE